MKPLRLRVNPALAHPLRHRLPKRKIKQRKLYSFICLNTFILIVPLVGVAYSSLFQNQPSPQPSPPARVSKTSLLAAPSSDEIKAVVHAAKTKSVYHATGVPLKPTRRRAAPPDSAVLTALRRAMNRDRQIRA
ncbi:hypothetical protein OESDEN_06020 [Oesophagostomum dentatum]|uniref:Transmembrane protein n=1 Tax=Oesophagostomum dentatum TaxID=61180 RepID=A0A0B1T919_OESDE|nr:hypothetical protein OESDEN_06020 [Oesophagostomum dentatum]